MNAYLTGTQEPAKRLSRFLVFALMDQSFSRWQCHPYRSAFFLPAHREWWPVRLSQRRTERCSSHPVAARPDRTRNGRELRQQRVPTFAVKHQAGDLPYRSGLRSSSGWPHSSGSTRPTSMPRSTATPGRHSIFKSGSLTTSTRRPRGSSRSRRLSLPGVRRSVEARRERQNGPLTSRLSATRVPCPAEQLPMRRQKLDISDDLIGNAAIEASVETYLRGTMGRRRSGGTGTGGNGRRSSPRRHSRRSRATRSLTRSTRAPSREAQKALNGGLDAMKPSAACSS